MILSVSHITKSFGDDDIIRDATFLINEHEKVAIVGNNGAGKTTLLNILTGELTADSGSVALKSGATFGYLRQINDIDSDYTILEEMNRMIEPILQLERDMTELHELMDTAGEDELARLYERYDRLNHAYEQADGYSARSRAVGILKGLGFAEADFDKQVRTLSGGQKTRLFLGKILISRPDIIFLDEPTNHLDLGSIEWLEGYLLNYPGAVVIVSHDRYFLDKIASKVIDIDRGQVESYVGNYTDYVSKKQMLRDAALKAYEKQQDMIRHQESVIEKLQSYNREKSIKRAESRIKLLDKLDRLEKPTEEKADMQLHFEQTASSGKDVLSVEHISKSFGAQTLFTDLSFELKRGEHVCIIGDNGTGKTTILKMLTGLLEPDAGSITFGAGVMIAYYDQEQHNLDYDKTIFDELQDTYPDMNDTRVRSTLAAFLFTGDEVFKKISSLSGGERGRVSLAKLMLSKANLIILDEPTNHLDMTSKEILENAIRSYEGTVLCVSHDRYFINRTATRILNLTHERLLDYIGNYDYYLEKRADMEAYKGVSDSAAGSGPFRRDIKDPGSSCGGTEALGSSPCRTDTVTDAKGSSLAESSPSHATFTRPSAPAAGSAEAFREAKARNAALKKHKAALERTETDIQRNEDRIREIDEAFLDPSIQTDAYKLRLLQEEKDECEARLSELMDEWERLESEEI